MLRRKSGELRSGSNYWKFFNRHYNTFTYSPQLKLINKLWHTQRLCTRICNLQLTKTHLPSVCGRDPLTELRGVPLLLSDHQHTPRRVECGHYLLSAYWHPLALKWETPLCTADQLDRLSLMEYAHLLIHVPVNMQCHYKTTYEYTATWQV